MSSFTPQELDEPLPTSQSTANTIARISNPSTRSRVQTYAYLLGASSEMPEITQEEINQHQAVQSCYDAMSGINPALPDSQANSPEDEACELFFWCLLSFAERGCSPFSDSNQHHKGRHPHHHSRSYLYH